MHCLLRGVLKTATPIALLVPSILSERSILFLGYIGLVKNLNGQKENLSNDANWQCKTLPKEMILRQWVV